mgnify:FL=1|jgi:hypothetical protein|tara:strand:+ start:586 stop:1200 length:615 start_codon:yes stop_codon:yes gene_type:complete
MSIVKLNNRGVRSVTSFGSLTSGSMAFIKKLTASSSATLSFVDGASDVVLDNTYKEYIFTFNNIHPATNNANFTFNMSIDSGSNYNVDKTTSFFYAYHNEGGSQTALQYRTDYDITGTGFHILAAEVGNGNDETASGYVHLFNPSSTTFVKHFLSRASHYQGSDYMIDNNTAGYGNTTSAVDAVQFKMSSGNIDAGDICLYGIN